MGEHADFREEIGGWIHRAERMSLLEEELECMWGPSELGVLGRRPALLKMPCWIAGGQRGKGYRNAVLVSVYVWHSCKKGLKGLVHKLAYGRVSSGAAWCLSQQDLAIWPHCGLGYLQPCPLPFRGVWLLCLRPDVIWCSCNLGLDWENKKDARNSHIRSLIGISSPWLWTCIKSDPCLWSLPELSCRYACAWPCTLLIFVLLC